MEEHGHNLFYKQNNEGIFIHIRKSISHKGKFDQVNHYPFWHPKNTICKVKTEMESEMCI